ncbi:hypothetical protein GCM10010404_11490 [Nonomuraea africana]
MRLVGMELITGGREPLEGIRPTSPGLGVAPGGPSSSGDGWGRAPAVGAEAVPGAVPCPAVQAASSATAVMPAPARARRAPPDRPVIMGPHPAMRKVTFSA